MEQLRKILFSSIESFQKSFHDYFQDNSEHIQSRKVDLIGLSPN